MLLRSTLTECYWTGLRQTRWARAVYAANLGRWVGVWSVVRWGWGGVGGICCGLRLQCCIHWRYIHSGFLVAAQGPKLMIQRGEGLQQGFPPLHAFAISPSVWHAASLAPPHESRPLCGHSSFALLFIL